jgi:hypothetical protein
MPTVGSILHGAYGDYYEQLLCLKQYKRTHPDTRLVLFFASEHRRKELAVLDLSFADEVHGAEALASVPVDRFFQFQIRDPELQSDVLAKLPDSIRAKFDDSTNHKPWSYLRGLDFSDPDVDVGLNAAGNEVLPKVMAENGLDEALFRGRFTVGFLWRYRNTLSAISPLWQTSESVARQTKADLLGALIRRYDAHVIVAGMNVRRNQENWYRIEAKFSDKDLGLPASRCTYLKGLSWALEVEIMRRCSLCLVMPSGFSEALWIKRAGPTVLVDAPPHYLVKLLWNRMPLFDINSARDWWFQFRQPHTAERVLAHLDHKGLLPCSDVPDCEQVQMKNEPAESACASAGREIVST